MPEALQQVKRDLGAGAVILHTRSFRRGGLFGIGARPVVEVTASTDVKVPPRRRRRPAPPEEPKFDKAAARKLLQQTYGQSASAAAPRQREPVAVAAQAESSSFPTPAPPDPQLADEIAQIRRMVRRMMDKQAADPSKADVPEALFEQYLKLLEQEVAEELADEVVHLVRQMLNEDDLHDPPRVREAIRKAIAKFIPSDADASPVERAADARPRTIALIGPTGVGKTTTVAKLAATFKLRHKLNVALITIDTYRIAAVDQLRTYANIIGLPVHVVLTPIEMKQAIADCADADVVLIDTAGRSQRDTEKLDQLRAFIDAADPHEVHLVLSSTYSQPVMMQAIERFSAIRADRIILTKLDEAVSFGVVLNVIRQVNKQLSYVTTGQDVPHHIEPYRGERLAGLLVGEGL